MRFKEMDLHYHWMIKKRAEVLEYILGFQLFLFLN